MAEDDEFKQFLRKTEKKLSFLGILLFIDPIYFICAGKATHISFIIGYFIGVLCFISLCEVFFILQKKTLLTAIMVFLINAKLVFIAVSIFTLNYFGYSAVEAILGVFLSQIAMTIFLFSIKNDKQKIKNETEIKE